jgi:antitoxin ParD1/3/4
MNVSLTPELERLVTEKVSSGMYQTASEVVREGLRLIKERDEELELLRRNVRAGFEAVERGDYADYDESAITELKKRVKARGRKRLAERSTRGK